MEGYCKTIGTILARNLPKGFDKAWLEAEMDEAFSNIQYWYETDGRAQQPDMPADEAFTIDGALHALRRNAMDTGNEAWSRCTFTLFPDGEFKFDVAYDD